MGFEAFRNFIHQEVQRYLDRRTRPMPCFVDSYNPDQHTVKVRLQPTDTITGWIQIKQLQTGAGYGIQAAPNIGDPGWVTFHEDDPRAAVFEGAVSNDLFPPVPIQAGEFMIRTKGGSQIYLKQDDSISIVDKANSTCELDGTGNVTVKAEIAVTVNSPSITLAAFGGVALPVLLADNSPSTVLKAQ